MDLGVEHNESVEMNRNYLDITSRIKEEPTWWDSNGVPRYGDFLPNMCSDVYAREVALIRISCQACGREFDVEVSWGAMDLMTTKSSPLSTRISQIHYGDPPNVECCPAGPTMNSEPICLLQFWDRGYESKHEWRRREDLEGIAFECDITNICDLSIL